MGKVEVIELNDMIDKKCLDPIDDIGYNLDPIPPANIIPKTLFFLLIIKIHNVIFFNKFSNFIKAFIGNFNNTNIWLNCTKGIISCLSRACRKGPKDC